MNYLKYVITGTGRCGTGFIAKYLTSAGVPCGHEEFFSTGGWKQAKINALYLHHLQAESSWLAAPYIERLDCKIIHLVRHPQKVIKSAIKIGQIRGLSRYLEFSLKIFPILRICEYTPDQIALRYVLWNRMIKEKCKGKDHIFWKIEDNPMSLLPLLKIEPDNVDNLFSDEKYNSKIPNDGICLNIKEIQDRKIRAMVLDMSEEYGYKWSE